MMRLVLVEARRALHRRAVRVLILVALVGMAFAGIAVWIDSSDLVRSAGDGDVNAAVMYDWWRPGENDGVLTIGATFLLMGGLIGGATVAGAEWRAGTVTTVLSWEPRRIRLFAARLTSSAVLAFVIATGLQVLFLAAFTPSVIAHGSTSGTDSVWWAGLVLAILRISALTALSAAIGGAVANLSRNTSAAIIGIWVWLAVVENLVRGLKPSWAPGLIGENLAVFLTWSPLEGTESFGPVGASVTLVAVLAAASLVSGASFRHRDISGGT